MNDKLPKYAVWVAIILLLLWGFYRSGSIERVTETETIGGEDLSLTIPAIPRTETEIRWIEKQSAANDISITSDCCTAPREYTAPVRNYRPPEYDLKPDGLPEFISNFLNHGWIEARSTPWASRKLPRWIQVQAGFNQYGPVYVMAELTKKGYETRKTKDGKTLVDGREVINHIDWKTGVAVNGFTAFALGYHRLYKVNTVPGTWPKSAINAGKKYWSQGKAF